MKQLLSLGPQEIQTGIWKTDKHSGILWSEGSNIVFRDLGFRSHGGALQQSVGLGDQARDIAQAYVSGARRAYLGTDTDIELYEFNAGIWTKTVLGTWPTAGQYADLETWGTWVIGTNNIDPVKIWKNTGALVNLGGTPFTRAKILLRKQPFLLAFNTNNIGDTAVEWSSDSNPELWTPSLVNKAGNYNLRDLESEIMAAAHIGSRVAVYSRSSMAIGTFIGGTNVWGWERAVKGIGAVSHRSVVTLDPLNYGLTRDGIFRTDGNSFKYIDDPAMLRYIRDTADFSKESLFWGYSDEALKMVSFYFLNSDNQWRSVSLYPDLGVFTKGDLQLTAGVSKEVFNYPLVASEDVKFGTWQESDLHFGQPVSYSLQTKPLDFGDASSYKIHNLSTVHGQWTTATLTVRAHDFPEDPGLIVYQAPLVHNNYFSFDAKYFSWQFSGSTPIYVTGLDIFGIGGGVGK
jgi:hypothetical protein